MGRVVAGFVLIGGEIAEGLVDPIGSQGVSSYLTHLPELPPIRRTSGGWSTRTSVTRKRLRRRVVTTAAGTAHRQVMAKALSVCW